MNYIKKIDVLGGMIEAINSGFVQTEIQKAAYKYELEIEANERIIVGVNKYQVDEPLGGDENLLPFILNSVREYASVGEICNVLREVFGEYKEQVII